MLTCDTCGTGLADTQEENVWFGDVPYPGTEGRDGMCRECGGEDGRKVPFSKPPTEAQWRRRLGRNRCMVVDARIPILAGNLSEENRMSFEEKNYGQKAAIIFSLMEKGLMF